MRQKKRAEYWGCTTGEASFPYRRGTHQDEAREGVYLMDEPEAALSPQRQLTLMRHIYYMALEGSQFIIATHSPILLGMPGAQILNFSDEGIQPITYEETESYQITKLFLERRESLLNKLFSGAED